MPFCARAVTGSSAADDDDDASRRPYCRLVAGLLRDMGTIKCQLGEMAAGCQLLRESAGLFQWTPGGKGDELTVDDVIRVAEVFNSTVSYVLCTYVADISVECLLGQLSLAVHLWIVVTSPSI